MSKSLHPATKLGPVHIKVTDLDKSVLFYEEVIGLRAIERKQNIVEFATIDNQTLLIIEADPTFEILPAQSHSGLYHFAILVPDQASLGLVLRNLAKHNVPLGQGDHEVSEALYLNDPDGNGIEIYRDRPRNTWHINPDGSVRMGTDPVDVDGLLKASEGLSWEGLPSGTVIGHVHFHVGNLEVAKQFYCDVLGFEQTSTYGNQALFIAAGGYHHHIGLNIWAGKDAPPTPEHAVGIKYFTIVLPNSAALEEVVGRLNQANISYDQKGTNVTLNAPFGVGVKLSAEA